MGKNNTLEFTGNWFIDAGILGFVNLMEEVYGWDLRELQERIKNPQDIERRFVYAFWYDVIKNTTFRWIEKDNFKKNDLKKNFGLDSDELQKIIKSKLKEFIENINLKNKENFEKDPNIEAYNLIFDLNYKIKEKLKTEYGPYEDILSKKYGNNKRNILQNTNHVGIIAYHSFFANLGIFNSGTNKSGKEKEILESFGKLLHEHFVRRDKKIKNLSTKVLDKSLSPFIYPASDFSNMYYGQVFTLDDMENIFGTNPVYYLLSFPKSFIWIKGKNYMFYTPTLEISYTINRELKTRIESAKTKDGEFSFLRVTWQTITDKIIEYKSQFQLEQMYVVEYSGISQQQLIDVEFIGLSKVQASILLDDTIREYLNREIADLKEKDRKAIKNWLLEEFLKNKPLTPIIIRYLHGLLNPPPSWKDKKTQKIRKDIWVSSNSLIYALAVESNIKTLSSRKYESYVFGDGFFNNSSDNVARIKKYAKDMTIAFSEISKITKEDERSTLVYGLLSAVKKGNKSSFVNQLMKTFLGSSETEESEKSIKRLNVYLFENILSNDISWREFALSIVVSLVYGGK